MKDGESWELKQVSDDELLRGLHSIRAAERDAIARVVAHLAEVEERRLHLRTGSPSMFHYCLRRLGMSENEAFRRVTAARLARRYPLILEMLAEGDIHLCAIGAMRDYLTKENHRELLSEASRKTKKQVEELLARRFPRPDVASTIRKLPAPRQITTETNALAPQQETRLLLPSSSPSRALPPPPRPLLPITPPSKPPTIVEPLSENRYRLQLNASAELKRKLDPARIGILGHSYGGNTVLFQAALDERVRYSCTSGAACSFRDKMDHATGIEMAEVLPGVLDRFDIDVLLKLAAPRPMLVVSASDDKYSHDADELVRLASSEYRDAGSPDRLEHARYQGGHGVTRERFERIVAWMSSIAFAKSDS